ncbi:tRNA wybutosine-synthesizing protein 5, partial [Tetrabaena socialis]
MADLPTRWERLGDLVLLPAGSMAHPGWRRALAAAAAAAGAVVGDGGGGGGVGGGGAAAGGSDGDDVLLPLWRAAAEALGVERLARQAPVANTGTRDSRALLLLGADGWVAHREGGVLFRLDVTRCMFSSGNVAGTKRVLLWPPACHDDLHVSGSSSPIVHLRNPDLGAYPRFASCPPPLLAELSPGDVLFLPSLWLHNVTATGEAMSISVNAFWRHLPAECYHKKDLYGNRDLVQAEAADKAAEEAAAQLLSLPPHYRAFYGARLLGRLQRQLGL